MTDHITITGTVATNLRHVVTPEGIAITSFRFASPIRKFDRKSGKWVDTATNWYTVIAFRALAINAAASLAKRDRLVITGRLRLRAWETGEKAGMVAEVEAEAIGHDLAWGTSAFTAQRPQSAPDEDADAAANAAPETEQEAEDASVLAVA